MSKTDKQKSIPAASLKSLAGKAPVFDLPVTIKPLGGDPFTITFKAKAQRKSEWAEAREAYFGAIKEDTEAKTEDGTVSAPSFAATIGKGMEQAAELIAQCTTGWDMEDGFSTGNLVALEDLCGGAMSAVLNAYDEAIFAGRLGN